MVRVPGEDNLAFAVGVATGVAATAAIGAPFFRHYYKLAIAEDEDQTAGNQKSKDLEIDNYILQQTRIIERKDLNTDNRMKNCHLARTIPNQRLQKTFGIDNIFTNPDPKRGSTFKRDAIKKMRDDLWLPVNVQEKGVAEWSFLNEALQRSIQQGLDD